MPENVDDWARIDSAGSGVGEGKMRFDRGEDSELNYQERVSQTGIFHVLFALFFTTHTIFIFQGLVLPSNLHLFRTILPAHFVHR